MPKYLLEIISFFGKVKTQWIVSFNGLVGLNYQSIEMVAKIYDFELTPFRMTVIQEIEKYILKRENG